MTDHCRSARIIVGRVGSHNLRSFFRRQQVTEHRRLDGSSFPVHRHFSAFRRRDERVFRNVRPCYFLQHSRQFLHHALSAAVLISGTAAHNQRSAVLYIVFQKFFLLFRHDCRMRIEKHLILCQFFRIFYMIQITVIERRMGQLARLKQRFLACLVHSSMPYIQLRIKDIIVVFQNSYLCFVFRACRFLDLLKVLMDGMHFRQAAVIPAGIIQNTVPVDLRSHGRRSPTEIADIVRSMSDTLHRPQSQLPRFRSRSFHTGIPPVGAGLLLHDAESRRNRAGLRQISAPFSVLDRIRFFIVVQAVSKIRI